MLEILEIDLSYTKVLLPLTYFLDNFLPLFGLSGTIFVGQMMVDFSFQTSAT